MKVALDTNVLAYAEGVGDAHRHQAALELIDRLGSRDVVLPVQVLGELFAVLVRKARRSRTQARECLLTWRDAFPLAPTTDRVLLAAADLVVDHALDPWDAVILATAAEAGCRLLLSEDLQDGFTWRGVTVVNPFATPPGELLQAAMG